MDAIYSKNLFDMEKTQKCGWKEAMLKSGLKPQDYSKSKKRHSKSVTISDESKQAVERKLELLRSMKEKKEGRNQTSAD